MMAQAGAMNSRQDRQVSRSALLLGCQLIDRSSAGMIETKLT